MNLVNKMSHLPSRIFGPHSRLQWKGSLDNQDCKVWRGRGRVNKLEEAGSEVNFMS